MNWLREHWELLSGAGGIGTVVALWIRDRRKIAAEARKTESEASKIDAERDQIQQDIENHRVDDALEAVRLGIQVIPQLEKLIASTTRELEESREHRKACEESLLEANRKISELEIAGQELRGEVVKLQKTVQRLENELEARK